MTTRQSVQYYSCTFFLLCLILSASHFITGTKGAEEDCPWFEDSRVPASIKTQCLCARNPASNNQLSVQCQEVDGQQLVSILSAHRAGSKDPLELLYLNGSKVTDANGQLPVRMFRELKLVSLQLSGCGIKSVHPETFRGQENFLKHLSLAQNLLMEVPTASLERLNQLALLDLSYNRITRVPQRAFEKLTKLSTLKLNDNNLELDPQCFRGLETSLRNLNMKGTRISSIPEAISNLSSLAFLDLAQNRLRDLEPLPFVHLHSLTALNLERNLLQALPQSVFTGVNDTLSSLSLLNNLITVFPTDALHSLRELRVLDLGFNLLTEIPLDAFNGLNSLTLLALDGNPLATLPLQSFVPLNSTLRGLSLGGRFLNCDCRVRWVSEWIRDYDLQVTSRERHPQFCGTPPSLRGSNFYQIKIDDLQCENNDTSNINDFESHPSPEAALEGLNSKLFKDNQNAEEEEPAEEAQDHEHVRKPLVNKSKEKGRGAPSKEQVEVGTEYSEEEEGGAEVGLESQEHRRQENLPTSIAESKSIDKPSTYRPTTTVPIPTPTTSATTTSTRKIPQPVKPFISTRQKTSPKISTATSTSTTTSVSFSSSTEDGKTSPQAKINTAKPIVGQSDPIQVRKVTNSYDTETDDDKIPVITGVGPRVNPNGSGSVVSIRPVQTQSSVQVHPQSTHSASAPHYGSPLPPTNPNNRPPNLVFADKSEILIKDIERNGDSIVLQWDSHKQLAGFRIIYRLFGEDTFRHGPPLAATERDYRIKNVPYNECVVVCVVPYDEVLYNDISPSAASVPPGSQCRELKPTSPSALMNHMDKITIGASAAICATVLLAVFIFIGITRRSRIKRPPSAILAKLPPGSMMSPSPGPQMATPGSLSLIKEWDQLSAISARSIPRARVYHHGTIDGVVSATPRSTIVPMHHSHQQHSGHRSIPDGHSTHRSYLSAHHAHHNHSMHSYHPHMSHSSAAAGVNSYLHNQMQNRLRSSMASRSSIDALKHHHIGTPNGHIHRHFEQNQKQKRRTGRLSQSESLNTLSGYETPDNWTDHDLDVYVARNATRHDLVQL